MEEIDQTSRWLQGQCLSCLALIDEALSVKHSPTTTATGASAPTAATHVNKVKLPKISLPYFSSDIHDWAINVLGFLRVRSPQER